MDISWNQQGVHITGEAAIQSLAKDKGITRTARMPYLITAAGPPAVGPPVTVPVRPFQALLGRLLFIARMWRLDIRYAVQQLCIKASRPVEQDQRAAYRAIAYLLGSAQEGVTLSMQPRHHHPIRRPRNLLLPPPVTSTAVPHCRQEYMDQPRLPKMDRNKPRRKGRRRRAFLLTPFYPVHKLTSYQFSLVQFSLV